MTMKLCTRCYENKPVAEFQPDSRYRLGVMGWCRLCRKAAGQERAARIKLLPTPDIQRKRCTLCGRTKSRQAFSRSAGKLDGLASRCKKCRSRHEASARMTSIRPKLNHLWTHYRMRLPDFESILDSQNNLCALCDGPMTKPVIDHCHTSGRVRGLLCYRCNTNLRVFENTKLLAEINTYLAKPIVSLFTRRG